MPSRLRTLVGLAVTGLAALPLPAAADMRLRQATLTLGGVGTFVYEGTADAGGNVSLDVRRGDIDDVLKSLTVMGGAASVSGLRVAGPGVTDQAFAALPFGPDALGAPLRLLNALRGVRVDVRDASGREIVLSGRLVTAVRQKEPEGAARDGLDRTRVTLLTELGLRQFVLEDVGAVQVSDPALQARIDAALSALRGRADGDRSQVSLQTTAREGATVRVAVVTATPLWKTTYRLVLPKPAESDAPRTGRLQGWAVLDNATAGDWDGVSVTLQSGNPVTFRQALSETTLVDRPLVPVDRQPRPAPREDAAAPRPALMALARKAPEQATEQAPEQAPGGMAAPGSVARVAEGIAATRFVLPAPVSLKAGEIASVPFLDVTLPVETLGLVGFQQAHPLAAVRLANDTGGGLPAGAVATFDGDAFAGDALLPPVPQGERRLLTFAEDLAVTAQWSESAAQDVTGLTVSGGVAHLVRTERSVTRVALTGAAQEPRTLLLELPVTDGATLSLSGATLAEQTNGVWRLRVRLAAGERREVTATVDRPVREDVALTNDPDAVLRLGGLGLLSPDARAAIERIAGLRQALSGREADRQQVEAARKDVVTDEERLRANLAAVPPGDPLHARLLRQLDAAETRLSELDARAQQAGDAARQARAALDGAIASLSIGG